MICSATQAGFRRRRSKEETSAWRVARSATGPGKPYWKRPTGSTGDMMSLAGMTPGIGAGAEVFEAVEVVASTVEDTVACAIFSDRVAYIAAVIPAPVAALAAAIRARVVLDILRRDSVRRGGGRGYIRDSGSRRASGSWRKYSRHPEIF